MTTSGAPSAATSGAVQERVARISTGYQRIFENADKYRRALESARAFDAIGAFRVPRAVATDEPTLTVVWERLSGQVVEPGNLREDEAISIGRQLRLLHRATRVEIGDWPTFLERRVSSLKSAAASRPQTRGAWLQLNELQHSGVMCPERLTLCHRDFAPYNLLADRRFRPAKRWGLIDFEHARVDAPLIDAARAALTFGGVRTAVLRGYAENKPLGELRPALHGFVLLDLLQSIRWADRHGDHARLEWALGAVSELQAVGPERWCGLTDRSTARRR